MTDHILRVIIFIAVNSGGVGKTLIAEVFDALARLLGVPHQLASYDHGNHALIRALGKTVIPIESEPNFALGKSIVANRFSKHLLLVDCGANSLFGPHAALGMGMGMSKQAQDDGHLFVALAPAGSGKIGGLQSAIDACETFRDLGMNCRIVLNNMNGAGVFGRETIPDHLEVDEFPYLPPALDALRLHLGASIYDLIVNPSPGFEEAGSHVLAWLRKVAEAPVFKQVFGDRLAQLPDISDTLRLGFYTLSTVEDVRNDKLIANRDLRSAFNEMLAEGYDDAAVLEHAKSCRDAYRRYWSL